MKALSVNLLRKIGAVFGRPTLSGWVALAAAAAVIAATVVVLTALNGKHDTTADTSTTNVIHAPHTATASPSAAPKRTATPQPTAAPQPAQQQQNAPTLGSSQNHTGPSSADQKPWTSTVPVHVPTGTKQTYAPTAIHNKAVSQSQVASVGPVPSGGGTVTSPTTMDSAAVGEQLAADATGTRNLTGILPVKQDSCVEQYVKDHVHDYDHTGAFTVTTVCGHPAVLLGGAAGIEYNTLRGHVNDTAAPAGAHDILYGNHPYLNLSAAHTGTGKDNNGTVLIVVTAP
ncbi:hypothetical protein [Curtobacterium sp. MCBD17_040]|uniref:hypothetical protein n=1 Tax=Curtobacterium sp. MCBD17_040 TaxID=2175674 RepID=UPI000DA8A447|nr:hypothetical protein [Curtobacterium sp. MCBD17_040]WIB65653.1 hypothetical protein DEI94_16160 [Curtobacterium sp. MCBD17_040]